MQHDTEKYRQIFESMSPEEIEEMNRKNDEEHLKHWGQVSHFPMFG
ncbi:MAG: hypothetical protein ACRBB6_01855 [Neptuniibacter sp.]